MEEPRYKTYMVPIDLVKRFKKKARKIRKETGANVTWTKLVRKVLDNHIYGKKGKKQNDE